MTSVLQQTAQSALSNSKYNVSKNTIQINTDIETLIKAEVFKKQIRLKDFFFDFDRLRKGHVTEDKFRSALSMLNMHMTEKDIRSLLERYTIGPDQIRYVDFVKNVDQQFYDYDLAKNNLETTKSVSSIAENEQQIITQILLQIKSVIRTKRIHLKQPFQDFDRTCCSHITVDQFSRVLTLLGLLPPQQYFDLLVRRYIDNGNPKEVNYVKFCLDVDNVSEMLESVIKGIKENPKTLDPNEGILDDTENLKLMSTLFTSKQLREINKNLEQVLVRIQAEVVMKRIRIREFFKDHDGLRKGTVTEQQFKRVLDVSNLKCSEKEISILLDRYKRDNIPNGLVAYAEFCEDVDAVFTKKGIDKDPLAKVTQIQEATTLPARRRYLNLTEKEAHQLGDVLNLYHQTIQNKRVLIKPHFEDFDKTKQGYISKNQFLRILNQFRLFPDELALNLILKRYTDKGSVDEVNYYEFCRDVDIYDEGVDISRNYANQFLNYQKPTDIVQHTIYNDKPEGIEDLLAKIRRKVKEQSLRVIEFLRDFDKLRTGNITATQMRLGLNMAKLPVSESEFRLLVDTFRSHNKEGEHVRWRDLCDAIDEVFTVKGLEKAAPTQTVYQPSTDYKYGKQAITEQQQQIAEDLKRRFHFFCKSTRIDIKQFFKDWDRACRNKITPKQFRQVLATVNFPLSQDEFEAICKTYYCPDEKDIRYVDFIKDTSVYASEFPLDTKNVNTYQGKQRPKRATDLEVLLDQIKEAVKVNRLRVGEYFKDYDALRKGTVASNKFRGVISEMKIDLDEEQLIILENRYRVENDARLVDYSKFLEDINIVFTLAGLEKDPTTKPPEFVKGTHLDPNDILSNTEDKQLDQVLHFLGEFMRKNRIIFKTHFQDKDRAKSGKVSFTRFRSILDLHKIHLPEETFQLLCKRFAYQGIEFNYVEFDEVLKRYERSEI